MANEIEIRPVNENDDEIRRVQEQVNEIRQDCTAFKENFTQIQVQLRQIGDRASRASVSNANAVAQGAQPGPGQAAAGPSLEEKIRQGFIIADGVLDRVEQLLVLAPSPSLAALLTKCGANTAGVLVAAADLAAIFYIEQLLTIQLEYDKKIPEKLQRAAEQCRLHETYDALLKNVTNLHELLDNGHDLPDSPGVQKLLEKMQVDVNYYYDIQADLNSEIEEAVAMLKSVKSWAILKYHAKWVCSGLVLGGGSYGLMCYKTGSYVDWRSCTLGGTVVAATIATGLYKLNSSEEQNKLNKISSDIEALQESSKKFKRERKYLVKEIRQLEISSSRAYPNDLLPSLRDPRAHVEDHA